jgi:hypothetical protein
MAKAKTLKSFRLSEQTIKDLEDLARRWRVTPADAIAVLVRVAGIEEFSDIEQLETMLEIVRRV